jgi:hypothetical protein
MRQFLCCLFLIVLGTSSLSLAQSECPEGFRYAGTLSDSGSSQAPLDKRVRMKLPRNASLDLSYQQTEVRATNGRSGMNSQMRPQDIPKGILIIPSGKSDNIYEQGWAVSDPKLDALEQDGSGKVTRYGFGIKLSCRVGSTGANPHFGECDVDVAVCYKPMK